MVSIRFELFEDDENEDEDASSAYSLSRKALLGELPELEKISIREIELDGYFAEALGFCLRLGSIEIQDCSADCFLSTFWNCLLSKDAFPSLNTFNISSSWAVKMGFSFKDLVRWCATTRPNITILGDGDYYLQ